MSLLVYYIGYAAFVGLGVMLLLLPLQVSLAKRLTRLRRALLKRSDARVNLVSDLIQGIRTIKLLVWMPFMMGKIDSVRRQSSHIFDPIFLISMLNYLFLTMIPIFIASGTFAAFVFLGNELRASTAFTALSLLGMLRGPLFMFPRVLNAVLDALVAVERATKLINASSFFQQDFCEVANVKSAGISVAGEAFSWSAIPVMDVKSKNGPKTVAADTANENLQPHLIDIELEIRAGQLALLLGSVGSGKSTLLNALLGECPEVQLSGDGHTWTVVNAAEMAKQRITGSVAYVPQVPYLYTATARDNILFGKRFDEDLYNKVVDACALLLTLRSSLLAMPQKLVREESI